MSDQIDKDEKDDMGRQIGFLGPHGKFRGGAHRFSSYGEAAKAAAQYDNAHQDRDTEIERVLG